MFRWWQSKKRLAENKPQQSVPDPDHPVQTDASSYGSIESAPNAIPEPAESASAPKQSGIHRSGSDWMAEVIAEEKAKGTFEHLPGMGKPLHLHKENSTEAIVNDVLKTAYFLPPWIELQHEIRDGIAAIVAKMHADERHNALFEMNDINEKINKFNRICPLPHLQKGHITNDNIFAQYEKWK